MDVTRGYSTPYIDKLLDYHKSRKDEKAEAESMGAGKRIVRFAFFKNPETGEIFYRKFYILDFRMYLHHWQKEALPSTQQILDREGMLFCVYRVSRRQGKTWLCTFRMLEVLLAFSHKNPIGTFYCLLQNQAERNTKEALESHMAKIPGAHYDGKSNTWVIPKPTLANPRNTILFRIIGCSGRLESKVGGRSDINGLDEGDGYERAFIERVAFFQSLDNMGINIIFGTEFSDGEVLEYYFAKAKYMDQVKAAIADGTWKGEIPKTLNRFHHYEVTARNAGIYSDRILDELKEVVSEEIYAQEVDNLNIKAHLRYYYRAIMKRPEYQAKHLLNPMEPLGHSPLFFYVDVGIGSRSDRMAFCLVQHTHEGMRVLWGDDIRNASMELLVQTYAKQCPFRNIPLLEWVLPHDAVARDTDHVNDMDRLRKWIQNILGIPQPPLRSMARPPSKKYAIDVGAEYLEKTTFHALYAHPIWDALYNHKRKEVPPGSGLFQEQPAKTQYRDRVDAFLLAARDHSEKTYQSALVKFETPRVAESAHQANMGGKRTISTHIPHPPWPGDKPHNPDTLDFGGF